MEHIAKHQLETLESLSNGNPFVVEGIYKKGDVYDFLSSMGLVYIHYDNEKPNRPLVVEITERGLAFLANAKFTEKRLKWANIRSWLAIIISVFAIMME